MTCVQVHATGTGGGLYIVNYTPYDWVLTYSHEYQMNSWLTPSRIPKSKLMIFE